jgi:hypothetical protein
MKINRLDTSKQKYFIFWLFFWYILGFIYFLVYSLPTVTIFNLEESLIIEGSTIVIADYSIVKVLIFAVIWPLLLGVLSTVGVLLSAEVVGYDYSSNPLLLILLYYGKLLSDYFFIFILGILSGILVYVAKKTKNASNIVKT